jgi:hypothetical protein
LAASRGTSRPISDPAPPGLAAERLGGLHQRVEERVRALEAEALGDLPVDLPALALEDADPARMVAGRPQRALRAGGQAREEGRHGVERLPVEDVRRPGARVEHQHHGERALVPLEGDELPLLAVLEDAHLAGPDVGNEVAPGVGDDEGHRARVGGGRRGQRGGQEDQSEAVHRQPP